MKIGESERDELYQVAFAHRDVRSEFLLTQTPDDAVHHNTWSK